jgi:hypothetical protein
VISKKGEGDDRIVAAVRSNHVVSLFLPLESGGGTD